jgi:ribosomal protein L18
MLKITKHNKDKAAHFLRRKVRVNAAVKASFPGARIIVNKSNTSIKAQVIDLQGKVICSVRDKKMK